MSTLELLKPKQVDRLQKELRLEQFHEIASFMVEHSIGDSEFVRPDFEEPVPKREEIFVCQ